jgi:hypothetical protein
VTLSIAAAHEVGAAEGLRQQPRTGGPDPELTPDAGLAVITVVRAAQLAGEGFLTGLDRQRADAARQQIPPDVSLDAFAARLAARPARAAGHSPPEEEGRTATWLCWRLPSRRMSSSA